MGDIVISNARIFSLPDDIMMKVKAGNAKR